jgi:YbgC/YbaW family acyl-CoA thioester hydrolase
MRTFRYDTVVTDDQIDMLSHLNNAAYLEIFEAARWAVLEETGMSWDTLARTGVGPVILEVHLQFRREVGLGEALVIESTFVPLTARRFLVKQKMSDKAGMLRASAEIHSGFLDVRARRMVEPPIEMLTALGIDPATLPPTPVVQGVGGAFLHARDVDTLANWYTEHLGLLFEAHGAVRYCEWPSADRVPSTRVATTTFALMAAEEGSPLPSEVEASQASAGRTPRVNLRVGDLDGLVARLSAAGQRVEAGPTTYGRFAWVWDLEGNKIELWEPPQT